MERTVEASGKTLEEAKNAAMKLLGVTDPSQVVFEELPDKKGLFNFVYKRVRATVGEARPKESIVAPAPPPKTPEPHKPAQPKAAPKPAPPPAAKKSELPPATDAEIQELLAVALGPDEDAPPVSIPETAVDEAVALLSAIVSAAEMQVQVSHLKTEGRYIHLNLSGPDLPHLIGRKGVVIDSLQYLANVIFCKEHVGVRLVLDGDGYRTKRALTLRKLALELAQHVAKTSEEAELEPLPAHERRIVHRVLRDEQAVTTYSEGLEPDRRVVISPRSLSSS
ncbi:MAG: KH domain-containing protein [Fimbriimonadia bacterium]